MQDAKGKDAFRDKIDIEGLDHPKKVFDLTDALIRRGYGDDDIRAILGDNFKRVLGEIWSQSAPEGDPSSAERKEPDTAADE